MSQAEQSLDYWPKLSSQAQDQVLQFAASLKPQPEFVPQTSLGEKLWEIRQATLAP